VVRRLLRAPVFLATMLGTLTVGLGAFAVVYTAVERVLLAPLPYEEPDDLYYVWRNYTWIPLERGWLAGTDIAALAASGEVVTDMAGMQMLSATLSDSGDDKEPEQIDVLSSTANLFDVLGVQPIIGRVFAPNEAGPDRPNLLVLGHELWTLRFRGDSAVVGSEVRLAGVPYAVIGVMGPEFRFVQHSSLGPPRAPDAYSTLSVNLAETEPGGGSYAGILRVRAGTAPERVTEVVDAVGRALDAQHNQSRGLFLYPVGLRPDLLARVRPAFIAVAAAGAFLLLVLAVNLASVLLARVAQRERELGVSRALGATRFALVRSTVLEGTLLGVLGGMGGALLAVWGTRLLVGLAPEDLPRLESMAVNARIVVSVIAVGGLLGLSAGVLPAVWSTRIGLDALLGSAAARGGGGYGRLRSGMVVLQVALSLVLLSAGGLVVKSFQGLLRAQPGFEPDRVLTFRITAPLLRYAGGVDLVTLHKTMEAELGALPGVTHVGASSSLPLRAASSQTPISFPDAPGNTGDGDHDAPLLDWMQATGGYFDALGIRILSGRTYGDGRTDQRREAIIDAALAETFFPGADPLGTRLRFRGDTLTVVGVVGHARLYDVHRDDRAQVFIRDDDFPARTHSWALRTSGDPAALIPRVREAMRRIDPELALWEVRTMDEVVADSLRQQRLSAVLIGGFSIGALLLAAMGLFGVVSAAVTRRRHELAVRLALGAEQERIVRLVLREGGTLVALGVLLGVPGIYLSSRAIGGVLVGVSPFDAPTLIGVSAGLLLVALAACYLPARRIAHIEPAKSLRQE
jgi:putative ABC transport system permease protein